MASLTITTRHTTRRPEGTTSAIRLGGRAYPIVDVGSFTDT